MAKFGSSPTTSLSGPAFNKNINMVAVFIATILYIALIGINIYLYLQTKDVVQVVQTKGQVVRNQIVTEANIQSYDMTKSEFIRLSTRRTGAEYENRVVKWEDRNKILNSFYAFSKPDQTYVMWGDLIKSYEDNSSLVKYQNRGKVITLLDIEPQEVLAFKRQLTVGDRINIDCSFLDTYQTIVGVRNTTTQNLQGRSTIDIDTIKTDTVFNGVAIADILNGEGNSVLDYMNQFNSLSLYEQIQLEGTQEYEKATKASKIVLALTPGQYMRYLQYRSKSNIKFWISIPQSYTKGVN